MFAKSKGGEGGESDTRGSLWGGGGNYSADEPPEVKV